MNRPVQSERLIWKMCYKKPNPQQELAEKMKKAHLLMLNVATTSSRYWRVSS